MPPPDRIQRAFNPDWRSRHDTVAVVTAARSAEKATDGEILVTKHTVGGRQHVPGRCETAVHAPGDVVTKSALNRW